MTVELFKERALVLEVVGREGRLVVHLERVSRVSEWVHMMVMLHSMCKRVHVGELGSMECCCVGSGHGEGSVQAQAKTRSVEVTCLRVVEGVCATRGGSVVAWHLVCEGVERGAVWVKHRGGEAGAAKVPLFGRGSSRSGVGILDVVVLGELPVTAMGWLVIAYHDSSGG